jgi:hypothetical protein
MRKFLNYPSRSRSMKMREEKKGYRLFTEYEKRDNQLRDALKTVRGTKKYYPPHARE